MTGHCGAPGTLTGSAGLRDYGKKEERKKGRKEVNAGDDGMTG